jgi:hypothetical protein
MQQTCCGRVVKRRRLGWDNVLIVLSSSVPVLAGSAEVVDRAPLEHRSCLTIAPGRMITVTSGLHAAPVSATEHRSSTEQSTRDTQMILLAANLQVTALLRVRRQGLEPRTRGLRVRKGQCRIDLLDVG